VAAGTQQARLGAFSFTDSAAKKRKDAGKGASLEEKYLVIVECRDERHQVEVLRACQEAGYSCKAVMS
jgi:hypothetical protein